MSFISDLFPHRGSLSLIWQSPISCTLSLLTCIHFHCIQLVSVERQRCKFDHKNLSVWIQNKSSDFELGDSEAFLASDPTTSSPNCPPVCCGCTEANSQGARQAQVHHAVHQEDGLSDGADRPLPPLEVRGARRRVQLRRLRHVRSKKIHTLYLLTKGHPVCQKIHIITMWW